MSRLVAALGAALLLAPAASVYAQVPSATPALAVQARAIHRDGERISRRVQGQLDEARQRRDARASRCLDVTLSQINATLRMVERRIDEVRGAVTQEEHAHARRVLGVHRERLVDLGQEAHACLGIDATGRNRTVVTMTVLAHPMGRLVDEDVRLAWSSKQPPARR